MAGRSYRHAPGGAGSRRLRDRHPEIEYLAGAYFHQDYDLEADSPMGVIRKFRTDEAPGQVQALREALRLLIDSGANEQQLAEVWLRRGAGASYDPRTDGLEFSGFLKNVVDELS
ncbi:contact-dependent growth inhibition system immunity protein [Nocardia sp. NPDC051750]|uniref:contact-dependent growth inhibition system immunity protein n=1 Tax=Nocardia sp. NPDC051750 TaxID=3364325 RepID=UPI0037B46E9D